MVDYELFTDRVRKVMALAEKLVQQLGFSQIEPELLLLGICIEGTGVGAGTLHCMGVNAAQVRQTISIRPPAEASATFPAEWSSRATNALSRAQAEANALGHNWIGTEHLLLGIMSNDDLPICDVALRVGHSVDAIRREVLTICSFGR